MQVRADEVVTDTNSPVNTEMVGHWKCSDQSALKLKEQPVRHLKRSQARAGQADGGVTVTVPTAGLDESAEKSSKLG